MTFYYTVHSEYFNSFFSNDALMSSHNIMGYHEY